MQFKRNLSICMRWGGKLKVHFLLERYCSQFILTSAFICLQSSFLFQHGKKDIYEAIYNSRPYASVRKHPNNDNKIYPLPSSTRFQKQFHEWFHVLRYNSDLSKLEWTLLLFSFNNIGDLTINRKLFSIPVADYASFSHHARTNKTNLLGLISSCSKYHFKPGTICPLFWSSHVFTPLEFDSYHFWKIVKPCDHNEVKTPIGKVFQKYKPIRHYFVMSQK